MMLSNSSSLRVGLVIAVAAAGLAVGSSQAQDSAPAAKAPAATAPAASQPAKDLPKADGIVHAAIEAMGGKKAFDDLKSVAIKANMSTPMGDMSMEMKSAKPSSFLLKQVLPGMGESAMGSNGTVGWSQSPMGFQLLDKDQVEQIRTQSNMYRMVFDLEQDFPTMETVDMVKFNNMDCYKIKMHSKTAEAPDQLGFFAVEGKLMQGMEVTQDGPMGATTTTITFSDWKKIEPLTLFTKLNIDQGGVAVGPMNITDVEFNKLEPSVFDPPAEVADLMKEKAAASQPASTPAASQPGSH